MIFGHCTTHSQGLKSKWLAWEGCQFSIGTGFYSICIFIGNGEKNVILYLPIESSMRTRYIANIWGTKYIATQKEEEAMRRPKALAKVAICSESNSIILLIILLTFLCPRLTTQSHDSSLVI